MYEAREAAQALEAKRSMVRHIGHEVRTEEEQTSPSYPCLRLPIASSFLAYTPRVWQIRTPLNIVGVGADVLRTELKALGDRVPGALLELVDGIADASTAALEVINELLM